MHRSLIVATLLWSLLAVTGCTAKQAAFPSDGQHVVLNGTVYGFDGITAKDGSKYVVFMLHFQVGSVPVLAPGRPNLYDGDKVTVSGTFHRKLSTPFNCSWRGAFCVGNGTRTGVKKFQDIVVADARSL